MDNLNTTSYNKHLLDIVLLLVRVFVGIAMITHGYEKLQMLFSGENVKFFDFLGIGDAPSLALAVFAEVLCSFFLILGLFTRFAAVPLIITMLVATFAVHGSDPFAMRESASLYLFHYLMILVTGAGRFSIDGMISKKQEQERRGF